MGRSKPFSLKRQPGRDLPNPWGRASERARRGDLSEERAVDIGSVVGIGGLSELGVIQRVEILQTKLQTDAFGDGGSLGQSQIKICQTRPTQVIAMQPVRAVRGIGHGMNRGKTRIYSSVVVIVFQGNIGEAVGIEIEVAGHLSGGDLATAVWSDIIGNFVDRPLAARIKDLDRTDDGCVSQIRIASAGSSRVCRIVNVRQGRADINRKSGTPGKDRIKALLRPTRKAARSRSSREISPGVL